MWIIIGKLFPALNYGSEPSLLTITPRSAGRVVSLALDGTYITKNWHI